jgi:mannan endo-1,4-beta-mannosidase
MALGPDFVRTRGTSFVLGDEPFAAVGVNCYFLAYCSDTTRQQVFDTAKQMGAGVIRSWAFLDRAALADNDVTFQYAAGGKVVINDGPNGIERLDALIAAAEQAELRLILPLVNHWDAFGGMPMYLQWLFGKPTPVDQFYSAPEARAAYSNWVTAILTRTNTRTGQPYRESPAILAWELTNEARCEVPGGRELLLAWTSEMSRLVKQLDPNHLVALGDEGFFKHNFPPNHMYAGKHGVDFEATLGIPEIDFGTYHFYPGPGASGVPNSFGNTWIADHIAAGERANKPALLEEYGARIGPDVANAADRDDCYANWLASNFMGGGAGDLIWMLGSHASDVAGYRDDYTVYSADEVPSVAAHAAVMREPRRAAGTT